MKIKKYLYIFWEGDEEIAGKGILRIIGNSEITI